MTTRRGRSLLAGLAIVCALLPLAPIEAVGATRSSTPLRAATRRTASEVQTLWTNEFGEPHPTGVAYLPRTGEFLAAQVKSRGTRIVLMNPTGVRRGSVLLPHVSDPGTIAFDPASNRLTAIDGHTLVSVRAGSLHTDHPRVRRTSLSGLGLGRPRAATFAARRGTWFILDGTSIVRVRSGRSPRVTGRIPIGRLGGIDVRGIAFNPEDGLLYVANPSRDRLYALTRSGTRKATYPIHDLRIHDLRAMTFAPSADPTDAASIQDLYVVDNGTSSRDGGVMEVRLTTSSFSPAASAPTVQASLVQTIDTSQWSPASPDPSGIEYMSGADRFIVCDSEVEEVTGAGYHNVNMWTIRRTGAVTDTGTTWTPAPGFSKEPTGLGYDPSSNTLFISDDSATKVWVDKTGSDNRFGTADDNVTSVNAANFSPASTDTEDPEFQAVQGLPSTGHLFVLDGVASEIYNVNPVDGVFGNGNDTVTHFDIGLLGPSDWEGLGSDPSTGNLLVGARTTDQIFEITPTGTLVRIIGVSNISGLSYVSGVQMGPASDGSGRMDYWIVDRKVDNGSNANENDGKLFEVSIPSSDNPPTATITNPNGGDTVSGTITVTATANDDHGVNQVQFFDGATSIGTDTNPSGGWSVSWNTTGVADGSHTLKAVARDTINQIGTSPNVNVTVDNEAPPTATITNPHDGDTVSGTITVSATANDDHGVSKVQFFNGASSIGTDSDPSGGWSVSWNTTSVSDGTKSLTAVATDTANQTGTSPAVSITVNNTDTAPSVSITAPTAGSTVSGTISITASASDDHGVNKVEFFDGATSLGLGSLSSGTSTSGVWSFSWDTSSVNDGSHSLTAVATDTKPQTTTSGTVGITVDNIDDPPTATVTSPHSNDAVKGTLTISATASDDHGVDHVDFYDGATLIGTDPNGADGWSTSWNTTLALDGSHSLTAVATDTKPQTGTSAAVTVTVDNAAPTVSISSPLPLATVSGTTTVSATADGTGSNVASVQFFNDGNSIGTDSSSAGGWSVQWNTGTTGNGTHNLTATATDAAGNTATSAPVTVTVDNGTLALDIPIATSADDAEQQAGGNVTLSSSDLDMMIDGASTQQAVGLRFTNVQVPQGATITSASIQFQANAISTGSSSLTIRAQANNNPLPFKARPSNITQRSQTNASQIWTPPDWTTAGAHGTEQQTNNINLVVQRIVRRSGWTPGNAIVFIITGSGKRTAESFDGTFAPVLHIEYTAP